MLGNLLYSGGHRLWAPAQRYLAHHVNIAFRVLLLGGDLLILATYWYIQHALPYQYQRVAADWWLAGFTATLATLFVCTQGSIHIHSHRYYQDRWIRLALGIMCMLCLFFVASAIY